LLPPLAAILLAITTRRVVFSLGSGVFLGALILAGGNPLLAVTTMLEDHLWTSLIDPGHLRVFAFTALMGAMVGVIHRSGGMTGVVYLLAPWARGRRSGQLTTWLLGLVVFFDDYANTLLLGTTLRPLADRLKISREKLAYLVDSTAAPVAGLALVSTWVAGEIGFIRAGFADLGDGVAEADAFRIFVATIPYRFYVLWALMLVPLVALLGRDIGPMWQAEQRASGGGAEGERGGFGGPSPAAPRRFAPPVAQRRAARAGRDRGDGLAADRYGPPDADRSELGTSSRVRNPRQRSRRDGPFGPMLRSRAGWIVLPPVIRIWRCCTVRWPA
jgi:Na+/H+ antiporter NhaC